MRKYKKLLKISSIVLLLFTASISISATSIDEQAKIEPHIIEKTFDFDGTLLDLKIAVEMKDEGSTEEINRVIGTSLKVAADEQKNVHIENELVSVWSKDDQFPTDQLMYAFSGTLVGEENRCFSYSGTLDLNEEDVAKKVDVIPYVLKTPSNIDGTDVMLQIHVELYCNGAFREIRRCLGATINVEDMNNVYIKDELASVWSRDDRFPTTRLMYAYSGTLDADEATTQLNDSYMAKTGIFDLYVESLQ